jgi:D-cysteine desulfhydrase
MAKTTELLSRIIKGRARVTLLNGPTPVQRLKNVEQAFRQELGSSRLFVKRDDHMALGGGGNKLRKLEFLLGDARAANADIIITTGGSQSNHARLTAAACAHLGLQCELLLKLAVVRDNDEHRYGGNVLLDRLFGATVTRIGQGEDAGAAMQARADALRAQGRRPYIIPAGGSNECGALGYAAAVLELIGQQTQHDFQMARIFLPNGGSGTHAGLAAGLVALGLPSRLVQSFAVIGDEATVQRATANKTQAALQAMSIDKTIAYEDIVVDGSYRGAAYGAPTASMAEAVNLLARREGLLLDPVYSGKAFAGMLAQIRSRRLHDAGDIMFLMTGGSHTLFGYRDVLA